MSIFMSEVNTEFSNVAEGMVLSSASFGTEESSLFGVQEELRNKKKQLLKAEIIEAVFR